MHNLLTAPAVAAAIVVLGFGSLPAYSRPGAAPSRVAPSSAGSTAVVPRPSAAINGQNSGNLSVSSFRSNRAGSSSTVPSGGVSTDI